MNLEDLAATETESRLINTPLPVAGWCSDARQDPITGLVAFPDFNYLLPDILAICQLRGFDIGIAIGDVDNLKEYVENSKSMDAASYGHLAGCALMQRLGFAATGWFHTLDVPFGCVSTFGGDEIIVLLAVEQGADDAFEAKVVDLRNELFGALPRSVSFGWTVARLGDDGSGLADRQYYRLRSIGLLSAVDQALFRQKSALHGAGLPCDGFVTKANIA